MSNFGRLLQLSEASKVRELTEEEKAEVTEALRPIAKTVAEAFEALGKACAQFGRGLAVIAKKLNTLSVNYKALTKCPNKRVVHLAKYGRKWRTRKKNLHRAARIVKKEEAKR